MHSGAQGAGACIVVHVGAPGGKQAAEVPWQQCCRPAAWRVIILLKSQMLEIRLRHRARLERYLVCCIPYTHTTVRAKGWGGYRKGGRVTHWLAACAVSWVACGKPVLPAGGLLPARVAGWWPVASTCGKLVACGRHVWPAGGMRPARVAGWWPE